MFTVSPGEGGVAQATNYYLKGKAAYYLAGINQRGYWFGTGAAELGLQGKEVRPKAFRNLLEGFSPDRRRSLVQNAGHPGRHHYWDGTFNDPKSLSVLWAHSSEEGRHLLDRLREQALHFTLADLEQEAGRTRHGKAGKIHDKAGLVFAVFNEGASRALDPHRHAHVVIVNLAVRQDGSTGALHSIRLFEQKKRLGKLYRDNLATGLRKLGLVIQEEKNGFHIVGVSRELCRACSRRRQQIERWLETHGQTSAVAAKQAALETRPAKVKMPEGELFAHWRRIGEAHGWGTAQAQDLWREARQRQQHTQEPSAAKSQELSTSSWPQEKPRRTRTKSSSRETKRASSKARIRTQARKNAPSVQPPDLLAVEWRKLFNDRPWLPPRRRLLYVESKQPFRDAPWSLPRKLKLPAFAVELPRLRIGPRQPFPAKWWTIRWKKDLWLGELRIQQRRLFPHAPVWSPVHGLELPALRFSFRKSQSAPLKVRQPKKLAHSH